MTTISPSFSTEAYAAGAKPDRPKVEPPRPANLRVKDALIVLGISRTSLYKAWKEGWGPSYFLVGKSRRIPLQAALAWRGRPAEVAGGEA